MGWYDVYDSNDSLIASDVWIDEGLKTDIIIGIIKLETLET